MIPIKCDPETIAACIDRLLASFPIPVGLEEKVWAENMGTLLMRYSPEAVREATNDAIFKFKKLPLPAHMVDLLADNKDHHDKVRRYAQYEPPKIEKRYEREFQTVAERQEAIKAALDRNGIVHEMRLGVVRVKGFNGEAPKTIGDWQPIGAIIR